MSDEKPFAEVVRKMRAAQRAYFKSRDRAALDESIRLEREVDAALDGAGEHQGGLFSSEPSAAVSAERRDAAAKALREAAVEMIPNMDDPAGTYMRLTSLRAWLERRADAISKGIDPREPSLLETIRSKMVFVPHKRGEA